MRVAISPARAAAVLAALVAVAALYAGLRWGSSVAGGADSYGYVIEAGMWRQGAFVLRQDIVHQSPWPDATATWMPLSYVQTVRDPADLVSQYSPGLPLLMALFQLLGGYCGAFVVVPLCGGALVWLTYSLGRRLFEAPGVALGGAVLVATSPVFLYQLMNPMSDVPVTAAWTLALVLAAARRPLLAGLATSAMLAIRPNLAPLAALLIAWMALCETPGKRRTTVLRLALSLAPTLVAIGWLNNTLYGSPLSSGYGDLSERYLLSHLVPNLTLYGTWMLEVQTPVVALAALYFLAPRLFPPSRVRFSRLLLGGTLAIVILSYVFFDVFDAWWYLRYMLPMWPAMLLLTVAGLDAIARRLPGLVHPAILTIVVVLLGWRGVRVAVDRDAFDLGRGERRYLDVARFVTDHTEPGAVVLSHQHSGTLRLYADRLTLRYDVLDPEWLDRALAYLQSTGRRPYLVLDAAEVDEFRRRFSGQSRIGALDWPPLATLRSGSVAVYDPLDRSSGESPIAIGTTALRPMWRRCDVPQSWPPRFRTQ
jgi:hypothetical protein